MQLFNMHGEPIDVYCPHCDCAYSYFPEIPENCWNCGALFSDPLFPNADKPADHFPIGAGLLATLAIVGGAIAGGIAVTSGWGSREKKWLF